MSTTPALFQPSQVELAAYALFASQAVTYGWADNEVRMEWDNDPDLRNFWRGQVRTVLTALGCEVE